MEPQLRCIGALHSPSTGIIDAHELMIALLGDAEAHGACLVPNVSVDGGVARPGAPIELKLGGSMEGTRMTADVVVNCAGIGSQFVASAIELDGYEAQSWPSLELCRGNYFSLQGVATPFSRLIYPVPDPGYGGLGVHITLGELPARAQVAPHLGTQRECRL